MEWSFLGPLSAEQRQILLPTLRRRRFRPREVIFTEGESGTALHVVLRGRVALSQSTAFGDTAMLQILGPGEVFGEMALVDESNRAASAVSLEHTETLLLRRAQFEDLRRKHPEIERVLVNLLIRRVQRLSDAIVEAHFVPVSERVHRRLLLLADEYGSGDDPVVVPLTQDEIASLAGTTRPTANRVLRGAEEAGAIRMSRGRIEIIDRRHLQAQAG